MRATLALIFYCFLFSTLFVLFYSFVSQESRLEIITRKDLKINFDTDKITSLEDVQSALSGAQFESVFMGRNLETASIVQGCPRVPPSLMKYLSVNHSNPLSARDKLLAMCKQSKPVQLSSLFSPTMRETMTKIGEGAFADVFGCQKESWKKLAIKVRKIIKSNLIISPSWTGLHSVIIPLEGNFKYNEEPQNTFETMQTEATVTMELSLLGDESRKNDLSFRHYTKNFMQIDRMAIAVGRYPEFMMEAWDDYDYRKNSDNDRPSVFGASQLYIVFLAENSGNQLGSYVYHSLAEAISILQQITATLAIGEAALEFEHRDLHRGNVLVRRTKEEYLYFRLDGVEYSIKSYGVMASIVDYTLSRVTQKDPDCVSHVDLKKMPWLFKGKGDIQFDVYRDVRNETKGHWESHHPYTNVLWINYLATKMRIKAKLKGPSTKKWKAWMLPFVRQIKQHRSARDVFLKVFSPEALAMASMSPPSRARKTSKENHPHLPVTSAE